MTAVSNSYTWAVADAAMAERAHVGADAMRIVRRFNGAFVLKMFRFEAMGFSFAACVARGV